MWEEQENVNYSFYTQHIVQLNVLKLLGRLRMNYIFLQIQIFMEL